MPQANTTYNYERVIILGGGISGLGAALLAHEMQYDVFVSNMGDFKSAFAKALQTNNIPYESGQHTWSTISNASLVVKSPGIPDTAEVVQKFTAQNVPVISEIEFAAAHSNENIIAVTGSNGKTTVTSMIGRILKTDEADYTMGGNIGESFAQQVAQGEASHRLLEVSSFQLDGIKSFKPHVAVLLNVTPDHLDRYDYKFENYLASKMRIALNQDAGDYLIYNADDPAITNALEQSDIKSQRIPFSLEKQLDHGASIVDDSIHIQLEQSTFTMPIQQLSVKGQHNTANAMAAATTAKLLKIRKETIRQSLQSFQGVEHRLEQVLKINKVQYINDSKATNVNATFYALDSMEQPTVWIVGGVDKGNDYSQLYRLVNKHVKAIICLGTDNSKIVEAFGNCVDQMVETSSMEDAVRVAYKLASAGDNVLLSPACASFDLFENYEDRGRQFKNAVRGL
ncbi:UDP-N-acetylmuramoyl-L-alanine--D-glutamate ligase [Nonlabens ponticola]|uniref:UDP-N-acetylmuramoylalanine--D-glutamate ligase n=1 Tax=Nonlabens ponticola TaxID=2496866 RepID=A0A3S9N198_9FLAO|nr:UDP-N-acetylmuramoyl-L-alanine--D-glutamate ligase [Nonlabens ponticola]AZQ45083.1 UDP-N-acetylmuramoyl-L-alanine--D-glutamate ligase [Nonlabens ponticola]